MPEHTPCRDHSAEPVPDLLTITEAAELLRTPVATLRYWRHLGTGPRSFRLGRRVLYRRGDLLDWIDAQRDQGGVGSSPARTAAHPSTIGTASLVPRARPRKAGRIPPRAEAADRRAAGQKG
jgi:hypothetical protein